MWYFKLVPQIWGLTFTVTLFHKILIPPAPILFATRLALVILYLSPIECPILLALITTAQRWFGHTNWMAKWVERRKLWARELWHFGAAVIATLPLALDIWLIVNRFVAPESAGILIVGTLICMIGIASALHRGLRENSLPFWKD